ncbi:hypothetical protein JTB14_027077 [Gonioctena quinquepunctata]|nr:hypothetical protein JTB14_027077 [Gonioctena quinquepunctata]
MAANKKEVLNGVCKYCSSKVKTAIKCTKCLSVAHASCANRFESVKMSDEDMICCQEIVSEMEDKSNLNKNLNSINGDAADLNIFCAEDTENMDDNHYRQLQSKYTQKHKRVNDL